MEITGKDLIARVKSMVEEGVRTKHRELADDLGALVISELSEVGLENKAAGLFDLFRKCKRIQANPKRQMLDLVADVQDSFITILWQESDRGWGRLTQEDLASIWAKCENDYPKAITELNAARSQATNVTAMFRPLDEFFYRDWQKSVEGFDELERSKLASQIESFRVADKTDLGIWRELTFDLFKSAAVFDNSPNGKSLKFNRELSELATRATKDIPPGMISEPSLSVYRQKWRLWIRLHEQQLLTSAALKVSTERGLWHFSQFATEDEKANIVQSTPNEEIEISLALESDPSLTASRVWRDHSKAINEVSSWLTLMSNAWESDESPLRLNVKFQSTDGSGDLTMRAKNFKEAPTRIENLLSALDEDRKHRGM